MRSEYCKFAHDFSELVIGGEQECAGEDASIVGADLRKKFLN